MLRAVLVTVIGFCLAVQSSATNLQITPVEGFEPSGPPGGPFSPQSQEYQLQNAGPTTLWWGVNCAAIWLDFSPENWGVLEPNESTVLTVGLNEEADSLPEGTYVDTLLFTNSVDPNEQVRGVTLTVAVPTGLWVSPTSFDVNITEGCMVTEPLTIGNDGSVGLEYMVRTRVVAASESTAQDPKSLSKVDTKAALPEAVDHDFDVPAEVPYRPGKLLVRFAAKPDRTERTTAEKSQILAALGGGAVEHNYHLVPGLSLVSIPEGANVADVLKSFNRAPGILYAEPVYKVQTLSTFPNDARFNELWGMHNTGQTGGTADADIDAPEAWDIATGNSQIIVAVIDTGVDYSHPDLAANMWVNEPEYHGAPGVDDDGNGYVDDIYGYDFCNSDGDPYDDHYHGTHCAGTIGAIGNNGQGVAGVCWSVRIMAVKFLDSGGSGWTDDAIRSVEYTVLMGADLSSNSWGGGGYSQGLKDAIEAAGAAGMLFAAASGNSSTNTDADPHYPSSYDCESLISVMATTHSDSKSGFSNWGLISVDLGAPGSDILSCQPGNRYQYLDGTSMATPHVAGACALLWSMNPTLTNGEVKDILLRTVDPTLPGLCVSGGRLNLYNAILETRAPWIHVEPEEGTVGPGDSNEILVTFDAIALAPGTYQAEIVIISDDSLNPQKIVPVTMTVAPDDLVVSPTEDFESSGIKQGPFEPECRTYTLTNQGEGAVGWGAYWTQDWLVVEPNEGVLEANDSIAVNVCIGPDADLLEPNIYTDTVVFQNLDSNSIKPRLATLTVRPPDMFTEVFEQGSDLQLLSVTFSPDGSVSYYEACRQRITEFPTEPNGGTYISLGDDDFAELILDEGKQVLFCGQWYDRIFVGSNGYLTFGQGDTEYVATLENHFALPRISAMFADLTPATAESISYKQLADRLVVTFQSVPLYGDKTAQSSFQIEIFFADGSIRISWLELTGEDYVAGLSEGNGLPPAFFEESDLSSYAPCWPLCDLDRNYKVDFQDFAVLASYWRDAECTIPFWCGQSDFDFSGELDSIDLGIFVQDWLTEMEKWWLWPVSHWKFDEGEGSIAYDSVGDNHGTIYGAQWTSGQINGALLFDGVNDYVGLPNNSPIWLPQNDFTVAAWVYFDRDPTTVHDFVLDLQYMFSTNHSVNTGYCIFRNCVNGKAGFDMITATSDSGLRSEDGMVKNRWYHLVGVRSGTTQAIYMDGQLNASRTCSGDPIKFVGSGSDYKVNFGKISDVETPGAYYLDGTIDDVRIYDRALSAEEIQELYRGGLGPKAFRPYPAEGAVNMDPNVVLSWSPGKAALTHDVYFATDFNDANDANTVSSAYMGSYDVNSWDPCGLDYDTTYYWRVDEVGPYGTCKGDVWSFTTAAEPNLLMGLVSHWKFDEGDGSIAYDSAGSNDGSIYGPTWTTGQIDGALSFDGTDDYVSVPHSEDLNITGDITICAWVYFGRGGLEQSIVAKTLSSGHTNTPFDFRTSVGAEPTLDLVRSDSTGHEVVYGTSHISLNSWHHVLVRVANKVADFYIDGTLAGKSGGFTKTPAGNTRPLYVARRDNGLYFDGTIDDPRIYDRALSAQEVRQLYEEAL